MKSQWRDVLFLPSSGTAVRDKQQKTSWKSTVLRSLHSMRTASTWVLWSQALCDALCPIQKWSQDGDKQQVWWAIEALVEQAKTEMAWVPCNTSYMDLSLGFSLSWVTGKIKVHLVNLRFERQRHCAHTYRTLGEYFGPSVVWMYLVKNERPCPTYSVLWLEHSS